MTELRDEYFLSCEGNSVAADGSALNSDDCNFRATRLKISGVLLDPI